ncbi:hypothetical protein Tcan_04502 [Toxocara canis]|uniref:Uncharacterized protein n=1 Tax=Toxocara canis TaxID=6265 RepID=A0A0B2VY87_TOXCA|nr:hypothetical protein Tcan_04502 [Toxocara canis]
MQLTALLLSLLSTISALAQAIKCYCTDDHCVPYGVCESTVCLVGILKSSNSVIRTCGSELIGCRRDVGSMLKQHHHSAFAADAMKKTEVVLPCSLELKLSSSSTALFLSLSPKRYIQRHVQRAINLKRIIQEEC